MGNILFVRHGQATIGSDDYDQLSSLGEEQARILGRHWAAHELEIDRVVVGPLKRQRQTAAAVRATFLETGGRWPKEVTNESFREHSGPEVVVAAMAELRETDRKLANFMTDLTGDAHRDIEAYFKIFRYLTRLWIAEELELDRPGLEPWKDFKERVEDGLRAVSTEAKGTTVVFTSGGPIGVAAASVLELDNRQALELSWMVQNGSVTEFVIRDGRLLMKRFNTASHFPGSEFVTYV